MGDPKKPVRVALICGGPSFERGISLNSARSAMDHLRAPDVEVMPLYVDTQKRFWELSQAQLYSNTPSDFDFKLGQTGAPLNEDVLARQLKSVDVVLPTIHGQFGEDGELQAMLERLDVEFLGSGSAACQRAFNKYLAHQFLAEQGYATSPSILLTEHDTANADEIAEFFEVNKLKRAIVKPARAGSSIGVFSVTSVKEALHAIDQIFRQDIDTEAVLEPFIE